MGERRKRIGNSTFFIFVPMQLRAKHFRPATLLLLLLPFGLLQEGKAQFMVAPDYKKLFPTGNTYKMSWWQLEGGGVYNIPTTGERNKVLIDNKDTTYSATFTPNGGVSYSARLGRYHVTPDLRFFEYIDYSLGYRKRVGSENYKAAFSSLGQNQAAEWDGSGSFERSFLMLNLHLNNVIQISDHNFIQNTIGVNGEYMLDDSELGYDRDAFQLNPSRPPSFFGQLHYRLGFGMRLTSKFFIIPSLETAVLNLHPFDGNSSLSFLNSRYQTVSLSVKFMFLTRHHPTGY
jgi:hypothetical protein